MRPVIMFTFHCDCILWLHVTNWIVWCVWIISTCLTCCSDVWGYLLCVQWSQTFPLDHISFFPCFKGQLKATVCLLTFQTALDFWSMTSFTPCLDWTPSGLLNCYCHNPFHAAQQNKAFVATFKAKAVWNIETPLSLCLNALWQMVRP